MDQYIAKTFTGLEELLARELESLGAQQIQIQKRGVIFQGTPRIMYRANLESRLALKILSELSSFSITESQDVYTNAKKIEWERYIPPGKTFAIETDVFSSFFDNTMYAALICKDAIVDRIREVRGERPSVDKKSPDIDITLHIRDTSVMISLNSSGQSLHIRGYKKYPGIAPLSEVLAAGLIQLAGWDKETPLLNPMCGSGSMLIEAHRYARNIPSQINRKGFSFQNWSNFDEERWELILKGAKMRVNRNSPDIIGFDYNRDVVKGAKKNALKAGSFRSLQIYDHDFFKYEPSLEKALVIMNPPYNVRLKVHDQLRFYNQINNTLYRHYRNYDNWLICPIDLNLKKAGFRIDEKMTVYNGPIKCQFVKLSFASKRPESYSHSRSTDQTDRKKNYEKPRRSPHDKFRKKRPSPSKFGTKHKPRKQDNSGSKERTNNRPRTDQIPDRDKPSPRSRSGNQQGPKD